MFCQQRGAEPLWTDGRKKCTPRKRYNGHVPTKVREATRMIEDDGWYQVKSRGGSHRQFKHPHKPGRVTIAGKPSDDLSPKTLESILRQAGLK